MHICYIIYAKFKEKQNYNKIDIIERKLEKELKKILKKILKKARLL